MSHPSPIVQMLVARRAGLTVEQAHRKHRREGGLMTLGEWRAMWETGTRRWKAEHEARHRA